MSQTVDVEQSIWRRSSAFAQAHRDFILVGVLFVVFRLLAILFFRPGGYIRDYSDYYYYLGAAGLSNQGLYPSVHYWLEYPPLFPWLTVGLYRLSLLIPPWTEDPRLAFYALLSLTVLIFEAGNFVLLYATAILLKERERALRLAVFYALLFAPVYILSSEFDAVPVFFMLLGLYLLLRRQSWGSGLALGVAFALKITPVILVAAAMRSLVGLRTKALHIVAAGAAIVVLSAPFLVVDAHLFLMPFRSAIGRSSWESIWAVLEGYFSYGVVGGDRFDRTVTDFTVHPSTLPWLWIGLVFLAVFAWLYTRRVDYTDRHKVLALAMATLVLFLLYSKGFSPQFVLYLLPFIVLLCPAPRAVVYAVGLTVLNFLEQPVYFVMLPEQHWLLTWIVSWRTLLLVALVVEALLVLLSGSERARWAWSRAVTVGAAAACIWLAVASVGLSRAYYDARYQADAYRPAIDYVVGQAKAGQARSVIFTDDATYARFYPFAHDDLRMRVVKTDRPTWSTELLGWIGQTPFWLWRSDATDPDLETWLDQHSCQVSIQTFNVGELFLLKPCAK